MKHNSEITVRTRQNLLEAFWELYSQGGIGKVSVREIVNKAGYNRSTFYEYFTDVYDVLEQIEASVLPDLKKHEHIMTDLNVHLPLQHLTEVYSLNRKYFVVLLGKNGDPAFHEKIKEVYKALLRPLFQSFEADDFLLECTLNFAVAGFLDMLMYCFKREENPNIEKILPPMWDLMNDIMQKFLGERLPSNDDESGKEETFR